MSVIARTCSMLAICAVAALPTAGLAASPQDAKQIVQQAVNAEIEAARNDQTHWHYLKQESGGNLFVVVETEHGAISRQIEENGKPASAALLKSEDAHIQTFIHDTALQQKQTKDATHDDKSATELLNLLAEAFTWKVESETPETISLAFMPDPAFHPPDMEARVMGEMEGTLIIDKKQHRIRTMKGKLTQDVNIGFGLLAKLRQGGTFDVERRQLPTGGWQITETHVHIDGRALFFKSIGQQQDEVKTKFTLVPPGTTLEQAVMLLNTPIK